MKGIRAYHAMLSMEPISNFPPLFQFIPILRLYRSQPLTHCLGRLCDVMSTLLSWPLSIVDKSFMLPRNAIENCSGERGQMLTTARTTGTKKQTYILDHSINRWTLLLRWNYFTFSLDFPLQITLWEGVRWNTYIKTASEKFSIKVGLFWIKHGGHIKHQTYDRHTAEMEFSNLATK